MRGREQGLGLQSKNRGRQGLLGKGRSCLRYGKEVIERKRGGVSEGKSWGGRVWGW